MSFNQAGAIQYYQFPIFAHTGIAHGVLTRHGGVSPAPWNSLNAGATVGDTIENVQENRIRSFAAFGKQYQSVFDSWLVHGLDVAIGDAPRPAEAPYPKADIIITDRPEVTLYMRFADCVPILLYDPKHHAIGLEHGGWVGTVNGVARAVIEAMSARYGSNPADLLAGIGPSICVDHYPVGPEVVEKVRSKFGKDSEALVIEIKGRYHLDLWKTNRLVLEKAGVRNVEISGLCTASDTTNWYSHRAEHGKTGRFAALMALS